MATVGIIANPASGKDIRRLVAHGSVFDNQEKVHIVRRVLTGLDAMGVERVLYMPEYFGIVSQGSEGLHLNLELEEVPMRQQNEAGDSLTAAGLMREAGVECIITLGGDGTNRVVAMGAAAVPIVPISTGTNNVFPGLVEGTVAGLAAAVVARGMVPLEVVVDQRPRMVLERQDGRQNMALIDVAIYEDLFIGSRAIWDVSCLSRLAVAWTTRTGIGLSAVATYLWAQANDPAGGRALLVELGEGGSSLLVPVAPGLIAPLPIKGMRPLLPGETILLVDHPCVIALDGEREVEVRKNEAWTLTLDPAGPQVVDIGATVREAARRGLFGEVKGG